MSDMNCQEIRRRLQESQDRGMKAEADCLEHLSVCADCRAFYRFIESLGRRLRGALDERTAAPSTPDGKKINALYRTRKRRRRIAYSLSGLAAAVILSIGGLLAVNLVQQEQTRSYVREENSQFVDDLFSEPLFEGIEYLSVSE
jgi:predicted anti-sigma-YlaC factor YlaD